MRMAGTQPGIFIFNENFYMASRLAGWMFVFNSRPPRFPKMAVVYAYDMGSNRQTDCATNVYMWSRAL